MKTKKTEIRKLTGRKDKKTTKKTKEENQRKEKK